MKKYEDVDLEFKELYVTDVKKEVIAFANTQGGILYIGIRKDGFVVGVENPDEVMLQISSSLKDAIRPDIMPYVQIRTVKKEEKTVVEVNVEVGSGRPYYLQDKGLKPSGVYVRRGSSSQPLSDEGIRNMIIENSGKSYEHRRSINQKLTFGYFEEEMRKRNIEFGISQMKTLHMLSEEDLYTNLALLLSDQCEHTIKFAVYQGSDKAIFRDRKEFSGSILKQLNEVFDTLEIYNKTKATFEGLNRIDKRDYPIEAIRETLLNSIVHRDYSFSGSTLINLYDDRLEFVSLGGLVSGISMEAIFMGVSQPRNMDLAAIFYRMRLIESYGTGIGKIRNLYSEEMKHPIFETATGVFRVVLPNCNEMAQVIKETSVYGLQKEIKQMTIADTHKQRILEFANSVDAFKRSDVEDLLGLKTTSAFNLLKELCDEDKICVVGKGKNSHYRLVK